AAAVDDASAVVQQPHPVDLQEAGAARPAAGERERAPAALGRPVLLLLACHPRSSRRSNRRGHRKRSYGRIAYVDPLHRCGRARSSGWTPEGGGAFRSLRRHARDGRCESIWRSPGRAGTLVPVQQYTWFFILMFGLKLPVLG